MTNDDETKEVVKEAIKTKEVVKEAIKEWIDNQVKSFGWLAIKTLLGLAVVGILYLAFIGTGHFK